MSLWTNAHLLISAAGGLTKDASGVVTDIYDADGDTIDDLTGLTDAPAWVELPDGTPVFRWDDQDTLPSVLPASPWSFFARLDTGVTEGFASSGAAWRQGQPVQGETAPAKTYYDIATAGAFAGDVQTILTLPKVANDTEAGVIHDALQGEADAYGERVPNARTRAELDRQLGITDVAGLDAAYPRKLDLAGVTDARGAIEPLPTGLWDFTEGTGDELPDRLGTSNRRLGSMAGADTNDPQWTSAGLEWHDRDAMVEGPRRPQTTDWTLAWVNDGVVQSLDSSGQGWLNGEAVSGGIAPVIDHHHRINQAGKFRGLLTWREAYDRVLSSSEQADLYEGVRQSVNTRTGVDVGSSWPRTVPNSYLRELLDANYGITSLSELQNETGTLNLRSKGLPEMRGLWEATSLSRLLLQGNNISAIPPEIGNLTDLSRLRLGANNISTLPPEIGNLTNLDRLFLDYNAIPEVPTEIGNLTNLSRLRLRKNAISTLPTEIGNLTNLTRLRLGNNDLSWLPTEISNLTNLSRLNLRYNAISGVPTEISDLTNLEDLRLHANNIDTYSAGTFSNLTVVTNLELQHNDALDVAGVDQILSDLANDNLPSRSSYDGTTDSNPATVDLTDTARPTNGSSNADYQTLTDAGWTVSIDT